MKRFTDTEIWDEDWFIALPKDYRDFWFYIKDKCDHAGIWRPNITHFNKTFDCVVDLQTALQLFNKDKKRIAVVNGGRWFLTGFIPFQYGYSLNLNNRVHASIISILKKNRVNLTSIRPQVGVKHTPKDKDKDKDKDKEKDKVFKYSTFKESNNKEFKDYLKSKYPEVNIELQFTNMETWIRVNPKKGQKKNYARFARNWIAKRSKEIEEVKPKPFRPEPPPPEKPNGLPKKKPTLTKKEEEQIHRERLALQKKIREGQRRKNGQGKTERKEGKD